MKKKWMRFTVCVLVGALICSLAIARMEKENKSLPESVKTALAEKYPGASIEEAETEDEGCKVYEVELELADGSEIEVTVATDGTVMEVENEMTAGDLPFELTSVLPAGAKVQEIEGEVTYAVFAPVALPSPETTYEVMVVINGKEMEITLASDGKVMSQELEDEDKDKDLKEKEDKEEHNHDEHDHD